MGTSNKESIEKEVLNLGCGFKHMTDAINVDISPLAKPDVIIDLEEGNLPFKDNQFKQVHVYHVLEHIKNLIPLMNEIYRVMKDEGQLFIKVPQGKGIWADPTHVRGFSDISFRYYCDYPFSEMYGIDTHFVEIKNDFLDNNDGGELYVVLQK